jgi:CheY-like chemotaxis protein
MDNIVRLFAPTSPERAPREVQGVVGPLPELIGRRVLLVEDNEINRDLATELLSDLGIVVETAVNGRDGVDRVATRALDLILMDIQMAAMDGLTATKLIRADERFSDLPIVAMTANAMSGDRERSLFAGMNDLSPSQSILHCYATRSYDGCLHIVSRQRALAAMAAVVRPLAFTQLTNRPRHQPSRIICGNLKPRLSVTGAMRLVRPQPPWRTRGAIISLSHPSRGCRAGGRVKVEARWRFPHCRNGTPSGSAPGWSATVPQQTGNSLRGLGPGRRTDSTRWVLALPPWHGRVFDIFLLVVDHLT